MREKRSRDEIRPMIVNSPWLDPERGIEAALRRRCGFQHERRGRADIAPQRKSLGRAERHDQQRRQHADGGSKDGVSATPRIAAPIRTKLRNIAGLRPSQ